MIKALIFDVDGTLADTEEAHRAAFNTAFREHGQDWYWTKRLYAKLLTISGGQARLEHFIRTLKIPAADKAALFELIPVLHATKTRLYTEFVAAGRVPLRPGISRLIREAHSAGLKLALASTTSRTNVEALLAATLGAPGAGWFDVIAAGDEAPRRKPAPDIYLLALSRLQFAPSACVAFEDSSNGVRAAAAAGILTIATPTYWTAGQAFGESALQLEHLGDPEHTLASADAAKIGATSLDLMALTRYHAAWWATHAASRR
jgi:HAD superfamily hydrolase (TIGR01509 family)